MHLRTDAIIPKLQIQQPPVLAVHFFLFELMHAARFNYCILQLGWGVGAAPSSFCWRRRDTSGEPPSGVVAAAVQFGPGHVQLNCTGRLPSARNQLLFYFSFLVIVLYSTVGAIAVRPDPRRFVFSPSSLLCKLPSTRRRGEKLPAPLHFLTCTSAVR